MVLPTGVSPRMGWLPVSVLAGVGSGVVLTKCGYLRLCMPRGMHKVGSAVGVVLGFTANRQHQHHQPGQ